MVYHKLEADIRRALLGGGYGNNKIIVVTDSTGGLYIYDFDEESANERIEELEFQVAELEADNESLIEERDNLEYEIERLKENNAS